MGLFGMLAAGGAVGAMNASNANVEAQNRLEMDQSKERMREEFYNRRYKQTRSDAKEDARSQSLLNAATYERTRADKLSDDETKHKRGIEIEGIKTGRSAASNAARIQAAEIRKGSGGGKGGSGIMLSDGSEFAPNDADSRSAVNLVNLGMADSIQDAYEKIYASKLTGRAAGSIQGLREGIVPTAKSMSRQLLGSDVQAQDIIQETTRDPKTGRLILK